MVKELHKRGFEKLRVIPSLSPSGLGWRCKFINETKDSEFIASNWIYKHENENSKEEIKQTSQQLADLFIIENFEFIEHCNGENEKYTKWYSQMLESLKKDELPFAFSDYLGSTSFWKTSLGNEIKTLPNEK
jgi:hypothetical protein